jgi:hypothetical protein
LPRRNANQVIYTAEWDPTHRRFVAFDDSGTLLGMSDTKGLVMGIARTAAINAARERKIKITVMVEDDAGTLRKQWTFAPPTKAQR